MKVSNTRAVTGLHTASYKVASCSRAVAAFGKIDGQPQQLFSIVPRLNGYKVPSQRELRGIIDGRSIVEAVIEIARVEEQRKFMESCKARFMEETGGNNVDALRHLQNANYVLSHAVAAYTAEQTQDAAIHKAEATTEFIRRFRVTEAVAIENLKARNWCINYASDAYINSRLIALDHEMRGEIPDGTTWEGTEQKEEYDALRAGGWHVIERRAAELEKHRLPGETVAPELLAARKRESDAVMADVTRRFADAEQADYMPELLAAEAEDKAHAEAVKLTTPDAGQAAFMGFAIAAGVYTGHGDNPVRWLVEALGQERGHVELWDVVAPYGVALARIYGAMDDQPGVFAYEVAEEFGAWWYRTIVKTEALPSDDECKAEIARLAGEFYAMGDGYFAAMI